jgi:poly(A) polymerase
MFERYIEISNTGKSKIPGNSAKEIKETRGNSKLYQTLHKVIIGLHANIALDEMEKDGILALIIPGLNDVVAMKDPSGKRRFKDLWWHTKLVVMQSKPKLEVRWAALFHDFGKPSCFSMDDGKVKFHGHEHASVKYFKEFARKTRIFTPKQYKKIGFLIYNLGYVEAYSSSWTESAVRRFAKEMGDNLDDLLLLSRADTTSSKKATRAKVQAKVSELSKRVKAVREKDAIIPSLPKGIGNAIIELGVKPGKGVGQTKDYLENKIKNGFIKPHQDIEYYITYLKDIHNILNLDLETYSEFANLKS